MPFTFLSGEGTFKIRFDGNKLIWTLVTFDSANKSSVSSEATADSGKCDAKTDAGDTYYSIYPNPSTDQPTFPPANTIPHGI